MDKLLKNLKLIYKGKQKDSDGSIYAYVFDCQICHSTLYFKVDEYIPSKVYKKMLEHKKHCQSNIE